MKLIKHIALSTILTLGVFGAVLYTSCQKSGCKGVTCLNTGTCSGGICACPSGVGGSNCETIYRKLYANNYKGNASYNSSIIDSNFVAHTDTNNTLLFYSGIDSNFTRMQLVWTRPGKQTVNMFITLANFSSSGATFTFDAPPVDTFTYTGTGTVSATTASLNLIESHPNSPSVIVTLNNFIKQ